MTFRHRVLVVACAALTAAVVLPACSSDSSSSPASSSSTSSTSSSTAPTKSATLQILVTNDDGYDAPGIDAVSLALSKLPNVEVDIVAPATNQSASGSTTTPGGASALPGPVQTAGGLDATAVVGFPADSVNYALDELDLEPDVVVSGINSLQNLGPNTEQSGTVGAATTAAERGIPAIAVSSGNGDPPDYAAAVPFVVAWVQDHRTALAKHEATVGVVNVNVPTCTSGSVRGAKQVPLATSPDGTLDPSDCTSTVTDVTDDVQAFLNGFAPVTQLTPEGKTVTSSTTFPPTKPST